MSIVGAEGPELAIPKERTFLYGSLREAGSQSAGRRGMAKLVMTTGGRWKASQDGIETRRR